MVVLRRGLLGDFQFPGWRSLVVRGPGSGLGTPCRGLWVSPICPIMGAGMLCGGRRARPLGGHLLCVPYKCFSRHHAEPPASRAPDRAQAGAGPSLLLQPCLAWLVALDRLAHLAVAIYEVGTPHPTEELWETVAGGGSP